MNHSNCSTENKPPLWSTKSTTLDIATTLTFLWICRDHPSRSRAVRIDFLSAREPWRSAERHKRKFDWRWDFICFWTILPWSGFNSYFYNICSQCPSSRLEGNFLSRSHWPWCQFVDASKHGWIHHISTAVWPSGGRGRRLVRQESERFPSGCDVWLRNAHAENIKLAQFFF